MGSNNVFNPTTWVADAPPGISFSQLNRIEKGISDLYLANDTVFNVVDFGAVGNGIADDTTPIANAAAAMVTAGGGVLYFPAGRYRVTSLPNFAPVTPTGSLTYAVRGDGSSATVILHYGSSPASSLTVSNPLFDVSTASAGAPVWEGFTIDGANSSGGTSGLRWGDVSYGQLYDMEFKNFTTGDGMLFTNGYGWTEGMSMRGVRATGSLNQIRFDVGSGTALGVITTAIASGTTGVTSIAVSGGLAQGLYSGQKFVIAAATSVPGVAVQAVTTSASVAAGATSIPITSTTIQVALVAGTSMVYKGSYGSYDYWTVNQLYLSAQPNQNGVVSEIPRGLGGNIDRLGTTWRMTGNFFKGATNTGSMFWLKGNDSWGSSTLWDVSCEVDGTGLGHKSVRQDTTASYFGGIGKFVAYYFDTCTGASYQYGLSGLIALNGYTDTEGSNLINMQQPIARAVKGGVKPNNTQGGLSVYRTTAPTSDSPYQNLSGADVFVTITFTATAANASAAWNVDTWNGLPTGANVFGGVPSGQVFSITFPHYHYSWAKVTYANCTASAPFYRYI